MSDIPEKNRRKPTKAPKNRREIRNKALANLRNLKGAESSEIIKQLIAEEEAKFENEDAADKIDAQADKERQKAKDSYELETEEEKKERERQSKKGK